MRRKQALRRGRWILVLFAIVIGYLAGGRHPAASDANFSVAESIALRFPQEWNSVSAQSNADDAADEAIANSRALRNAELALFDPEPMVPHARMQTKPAAELLERPAPIAATAGMKPTATTTSRAAPAVSRAAPALNSAKSAPPARHAAANRPGYMLDDAQIASIKARLHLTPDQERMWPAVEAALRNMAYAHAEIAHRRDAPTGGAQVAAVDPEAVEGLKSAAVPLIMSFDDQQKQEVRNLAHVMGLDQLAAQF